MRLRSALCTLYQRWCRGRRFDRQLISTCLCTCLQWEPMHCNSPGKASQIPQCCPRWRWFSRARRLRPAAKMRPWTHPNVLYPQATNSMHHSVDIAFAVFTTLDVSRRVRGTGDKASSTCSGDPASTDSPTVEDMAAGGHQAAHAAREPAAQNDPTDPFSKALRDLHLNEADRVLWMPSLLQTWQRSWLYLKTT